MKTLQLNFILLLSIFIVNYSFAQKKEKDPVSFSKHQLDINLGAGLNMTTMLNNVKAHVVPISVSLDYGITKNISLGFNAGYASVGVFIPDFKRRRAAAIDDPDYLTPTKQQIVTMGVRIAAHYSKYEKVNFYGGPIIGMRYSLITPADELNSIKRVFEAEETEHKLAFGAFVGIRYYIVKNMGIFAELGALHAPFQVGVNFRL